MAPVEQRIHMVTSFGKNLREYLPSTAFLAWAFFAVAWIYISFIIGIFAVWAIPLWAIATLVPAFAYQLKGSKTGLKRWSAITIGSVVLLVIIYLIYLFSIAPTAAD
ncbi:MAG: hypothetical protein JSV02_04740 [Dehalococcoidia bacterium]|nr:MAG: hypothetical protein JSV02_04740 [Dehalococcoidia bacterium]